MAILGVDFFFYLGVFPLMNTRKWYTQKTEKKIRFCFFRWYKN